MKRLLAFLIYALVPLVAFAAYNLKQNTDGSACFELNNSGATPLCLSDDGGVDTSGVTYSSYVLGNPAILSVTKNFSTAEVNNDIVILTSETGKTIYIHDVTLMANGTASGATAIVIEDTLGNDVVSFPIADLVDDIPANFASSTATLSAKLLSGLTAGSGVQMVNTGSDLATTTDITVNILYSVQ